MPSEIEVKIKITNLDALKQKLAEIKAELFKKRALQVDQYFDKKNVLKKADQVLRMRDNAVLTYKGPQQKNQKMKIREEIEVMVDNGKNMQVILERLGYLPTKQKEKYRESYVLGVTQLCVDETPMGNYLEIEGTKQGVISAAQKLGYSEKDFIKKTYCQLWNEYAEKQKIKREMVFSR